MNPFNKTWEEFGRRKRKKKKKFFRNIFRSARINSFHTLSLILWLIIYLLSKTFSFFFCLESIYRRIHFTLPSFISVQSPRREREEILHYINPQTYGFFFKKNENFLIILYSKVLRNVTFISLSDTDANSHLNQLSW